MVKAGDRVRVAIPLSQSFHAERVGARVSPVTFAPAALAALLVLMLAAPAWVR